MASLYRRLLGDDFDRLPASLRDFHDVERERLFEATFRVTRGTGRLRRFVGWLGRLPPEGEAVPMRLRVVPLGGSERWERDFGGHPLHSVQWKRGPLMVEQIGPWTLGFALHVEGPTLRLEMRKAWLFRVPWPLALAPGGEGVEVGQDDGIAVVVRALAPGLGLLAQYEGLVRPVS